MRQTPLPTKVELCTLCTQYVFAYTIYLEQVLKKRFIYNPQNVFKESKSYKTPFLCLILVKTK